MLSFAVRYGLLPVFDLDPSHLPSHINTSILSPTLASLLVPSLTCETSQSRDL